MELQKQDIDLFTDHVEFMDVQEAKGLLEGIFGKEIHQYAIYELTRAYVPYQDRDMRDNNKISWQGNLQDGVDRGDTPYYCPTGYMKIAIKLPGAEDFKVFNERTKGWSISYHGTKKEAVLPILENGFLGTKGCWIQQNEKAVYLSPSIEYCSHPRYAKWFVHQGYAYQVIFQCRTKAKADFQHQTETLMRSAVLDERIDPRIENDYTFEWVSLLKEGQKYVKSDQIAITGLLLRKSRNPYQMKQMDWWIQPFLKWKSSPDIIDNYFGCCWIVVQKQKQFCFQQSQKEDSAGACTCICCQTGVQVPSVTY